MIDEKVIEELRTKIGKESEPVTIEVEKGAMIKAAKGSHDYKPMYIDDEAAKKGRYGGLIASGNYLNFIFFNSHQWPFRVSLNLNHLGQTIFHVGDEYEYLQPIRPGDKITARNQVFDVSVKQSKSGTIVLVVAGALFRNQKGELVGAYRVTTMHR